MAKTQLYPQINIPRIKHPNRFYAFPIFGGFVKVIMLLPVFFWMFVLGIAAIFTTTINSFVVLFTGKYWKVAFEINTLLLVLSAKISYFFAGLTNRYPGFDTTTPEFTLDIPYPKNPSKFYAIPLLGILARLVLMIPFLIYSTIIQNAGNISAVIASFPVLFMGKYPEALFELPRDSVRLNLAAVMYFVGISDTYPSFWISMKHKGIKILFIILGILMFLGNFSHRSSSYQNNYHYQNPSTNSRY